jgi:hypothetical protein
VKKILVPLAIGVWVAVGLWFTRDDLDYIRMLQSVVNHEPFDKRMYLYGSDYYAYDFFQKTPPTTKILALMPDSYYYAKMLFFLYPREIKVIGDPKALTSELVSQYDYVYQYNPGEAYYLGAVQTTAWREQYGWSEKGTIADNFGNKIAEVKK